MEAERPGVRDLRLRQQRQLKEFDRWIAAYQNTYLQFAPVEEAHATVVTAFEREAPTAELVAAIKNALEHAWAFRKSFEAIPPLPKQRRLPPELGLISVAGRWAHGIFGTYLEIARGERDEDWRRNRHTFETSVAGQLRELAEALPGQRERLAKRFAKELQATRNRPEPARREPVAVVAPPPERFRDSEWTAQLVGTVSAVQSLHARYLDNPRADPRIVAHLLSAIDLLRLSYARHRHGFNL